MKDFIKNDMNDVGISLHFSYIIILFRASKGSKVQSGNFH